MDCCSTHRTCPQPPPQQQQHCCFPRHQPQPRMACESRCDPCQPRAVVAYDATQNIPPYQTRPVQHTVEYVPYCGQDAGVVPPCTCDCDPCDPCNPCDPCDPCNPCDEEDAEPSSQFEGENKRAMEELRAKLGLPTGPNGSGRGADWDKASPANAARIRELRDKLGVPYMRTPEEEDAVRRRAAGGGSYSPTGRFQLPEVNFDVLKVLDEPLLPAADTAAGRPTPEALGEQGYKDYGERLGPTGGASLDQPLVYSVSPNVAKSAYLPPNAQPAGYNPYGYPISGKTYNEPGYVPTMPAAPVYSTTYTHVAPRNPPPQDYATYSSPRKLTEWEKWDQRQMMNPHMPSPEELGSQTGQTSSYNRMLSGM